MFEPIIGRQVNHSPSKCKCQSYVLADTGADALRYQLSLDAENVLARLGAVQYVARAHFPVLTVMLQIFQFALLSIELPNLDVFSLLVFC